MCDASCHFTFPSFLMKASFLRIANAVGKDEHVRTHESDHCLSPMIGFHVVAFVFKTARRRDNDTSRQGFMDVPLAVHPLSRAASQYTCLPSGAAQQSRQGRAWEYAGTYRS